MSIVGDNVLALRTALGLSQLDLEALSGVPQTTIADIESNPTRNSRGQTVQKLAEGLSKAAGPTITASDLLAQPNGDKGEAITLGWFWRVKFSALDPAENWAHRSLQPEERVAWAIRQLSESFPTKQISEILECSPEDVRHMASGAVHLTPALVGILVKKAALPQNWIKFGDVPPVDEDLQTVINHRDGGAFLRIVRRAIDNHLLPELLNDQVNLLIRAQGNEKPPA